MLTESDPVVLRLWESVHVGLEVVDLLRVGLRLCDTVKVALAEKLRLPLNEFVSMCVSDLE